MDLHAGYDYWFFSFHGLGACIGRRWRASNCAGGHPVSLLSPGVDCLPLDALQILLLQADRFVLVVVIIVSDAPVFQDSLPQNVHEAEPLAAKSLQSQRGMLWCSLAESRRQIRDERLRIGRSMMIPEAVLRHIFH